MSQSKPKLVFFHQTYPAQFGPITEYLIKNNLAYIFFFSEYISKKPIEGIKHFLYKRDALSLNQQGTHSGYFFSRYFEGECRSMFGAYNAFHSAKVQNPKALIGHVGFGNLGLFHTDYSSIPRIGFFELFYDPFEKKDNRQFTQAPLPNKIRIPLRNATHLIELEYCTKCYSPTIYQKETFPTAYQQKIQVLFDGINTELYKPREEEPDLHEELISLKNLNVPIITFVARGLEAMRGFDIFMEMAHKISKKHKSVKFVVIGKEKTNYGSELINLKEKSFKEFVLKQKDFDLNRFIFIDWLSEEALSQLFRLSTCHFYWTVPFVLSWSFFQAMSSGSLIFASDTAPVRELITNNENGILFSPFDIDEMAEKILRIIAEPEKYKKLKYNARKTIEKSYGFDTCLPKLADFYLS